MKLKSIKFLIGLFIAVVLGLTGCGSGNVDKTDSRSATSEDTTTVTATTVNVAPVAIAGTGLNVFVGTIVTLNGSGSSDANGDPLTYKWSFVSSPADSALAGYITSGVNPSFTPDVAGTYTLSLVVNDGKVNSVADYVTITAGIPAPELITVTKLLTYNFGAPGLWLPEAWYHESIIISGTTMTVIRSGGAMVNTGTWKVDLKQAELTRINDLLSLADSPEVNDIISNYVCYDYPYSDLVIGDSKTFSYGNTKDPISNKYQFHQFPIEANRIVSYLNSLMIAYGLT